MKKTLLIFFTFLSIGCFAQFSKTHYIPPLSGSDQIAAQDQFLYISTPSSTPVKVKINAIGVGITEVTVSKSAPREYNIGFDTSSQLHVDPSLLNIPLNNKGFIIEAESLIYVAARVLAGGYNQSGSLVSKGISAIGQEFRVGAFVNTATTNSATFRYTFLSILATENNTVVDFSSIKPGVTLVGNIGVGNTPPSVTLNRGQSYVLATEDNSIANKDGLIGALVKSNKPIVMNCGSYGGTNGNINGNLDLGFDQIVPANIIGNEYIFVRGFGSSITERPLLVIHEDNTNVYINGNTTPFNATPLNAGQYIILDGNDYSANGSLYVNTSKKVFAYQSVGGFSQANQEMFFVPPLNCSTPNIVDNIPSIERIGTRTFTTNSGLNIVTEKGATVEIAINGVRQPIGVSPKDVIGNVLYETYTVTGLTGDISVFSTKQVYVSYFGSNSAATYGGYYSGFDTKPEIVSDNIAVTSSNCIPNVVLKVSSISSYDSFEWYFNNEAIPNTNSNSYTPTQPGYYQVRGSISGCSAPPVLSDLIPVSTCETDVDLDTVNDNIDLDNDKDGITNCTESYGNQVIDISNPSNGTVTVGLYSNSFTGTITTSSAAITTPFIGSSNGSFITEVPAGKGNFVSYKMTFAQPISLEMKYPITANATDLLNADAEYIVNSDVNKTITVLNPNDQLLIDTNYDGIYESGVKQHSSFEIRFRLNSITPLAAGTGTFQFLTYLSNSISFTHKNLSDTNSNKSTLTVNAVCVPKYSDNDGIADQLDSDSDNDGIADTIEAQINATVVPTNTDTNKNGIDNAFEPGLTPIDTDLDSVADYLDLDSDNDGILDSIETGNDLDSDGIRNYRDLDADGDLCNDVIEAGFLDPNNDGVLGNNPVSVNTNGQVISGLGYTTPNSNYTTAAPITITTQPTVSPTCELQNAVITLADNGGNTYQWQVSTNGTIWTNITDDATYSGVTTNSLTVTNVKTTMNGYKYRVKLDKIGNSCGLLSNDTTLIVYTLPTVNNATIIQCDDDLDEVTTFTLTVKNDEISSNFANETFSYYTSFLGATTANASELISTPKAFTNTTPRIMKVYARVLNSNGCFSVAELTLKVLATQIPSTFKRKFVQCDDLLDINGNNNANNDKRDGVSTFDFSSAETDIKNLLPAGNYTITFYRNQSDALAEINAITNISNYRNIGYINTQEIWGRVDSDTDNACYGLGPYVSLTVEKLPFAYAVTIPRQCDDNQDGKYTFNTATLESDLKQGQTNVTVTYFDQNNNSISSPFPSTYTTGTQTIKAIVTNNSTLKCFDETLITFTVDDLPEAFQVTVNLTTVCDDEIDPLLQDGKFGFNTSTFQNTILGNQTGMVVKYFDANGASLSSPLPNPFISSTQNITAVVENTANSTCKASIILPFIVNSLPPINLNSDGSENELVCSNLPTFFVTLNAGIQDGSPTTDYTYKWFKDNVLLPNENNYTLDVNQEGNYTVEVRIVSGCSRIRTIKVTASDIASITSIDVIDLADTNTVTVNVSGKGIYEYSLDEPFGPFQDSNFFDYVPAGIHEVYINDKNGCGTVSQKIALIGVPKFFTPNGDGQNDYWNVKGVNADFNANSTIYIYDRYGKLLKQITASSQGWDGTFTGQPLPSDDYWYTIKLADGREAKGHFSLKR
ncbi:T9SS type B sorting domain-containing protein [Flavobacterium sp. LB2P53]|uniref:T9SS type B sorting domain-containing protein n=1 Tax=Flavobacterium sp. LB2P53 TaxID=2497481 RepID=UPI000F824DDB|nr:T9SS type B sorting domain-containing protein [Flavobacterium sp. LB2P53]RTY68204.1 T9SS type B sorting domain-containing protein [Flavobacterium sp. LB2P53]